MARPLRIDIPGGLYHVTSRGLERREIVQDDIDRRKWLGLLEGVAACVYHAVMARPLRLARLAAMLRASEAPAALELQVKT